MLEQQKYDCWIISELFSRTSKDYILILMVFKALKNKNDIYELSSTYKCRANFVVRNCMFTEKQAH